jgi:hypothetical protein
VRDVWWPALQPTALAVGAILFATAMGAFGTAFTLASRYEVLPITIYNEFTNYANFALAASLSITLGVMTWAVLFVARRLGGGGAGHGGRGMKRAARPGRRPGAVGHHRAGDALHRAADAGVGHRRPEQQLQRGLASGSPRAGSRKCGPSTAPLPGARCCWHWPAWWWAC